MPIFFQQDIDADTKVAIWKIEEDEDFFLEKVLPQRNVSHRHKKLQHLAGRYLLQYLFPGFPVELIQIADTRKPYLENESYHFSISHCSDYAAVIVSRTNRVGVDAEKVTHKVVRIQHKFVSEQEYSAWNGKLQEQYPHFYADQPGWLADQRGLTLFWSIKEAVFKWYGLGGVDFRQHMEVKKIIPVNGNLFETIVAFKKHGELFLDLHSHFFGDLCLSYVVT